MDSCGKPILHYTINTREYLTSAARDNFIDSNQDVIVSAFKVTHYHALQTMRPIISLDRYDRFTYTSLRLTSEPSQSYAWGNDHFAGVLA